MNMSTNKIEKTNSPLHNRASTFSGTPKDYANNYNLAKPAVLLKEGEIIQGEVTDLRNNQVTITLEDDSQITGTLEQNSNLSIGEVNTFKVITLSDGKVVLKSLPKSEGSLENSTIHKALQEAGLPVNEKNQTIVKELLQNQMSINKQSIQAILQQSYTFKNISIHSLVLMNRFQIPITEENILQMELYEKNQHALIHKFTNLIQELSIGLEEYSTTSLGQIHIHELLNLLFDPSTVSPPHLEDPPFLFDSTQNIGTLLDLLETFFPENPIGDEISKGTVGLRTLAHTLQDAMAMAIEMEISADNLDLAATNQSSLSDAPNMTQLFHNPIVSSILKDFSLLQQENHELGGILTLNQRVNLLSQLRDFPLQGDLKEAILSGEAFTSQVVHGVKDSIETHMHLPISQLLHSQEWKILFQQELLNNWTFTPASLKKGKSLADFFSSMGQKLNQLEEFFEKNSFESLPSMPKHTRELNQSLDFMKTLQELFRYMQLPIKIENHTLHSELYVYSNKKGASDSGESFSVLLHLNMEYIGPLDVHITLANRHLFLKFYYNEVANGDFIRNNVDQLKDILENQGFSISFEFIKKDHNSSFLETVLEETLPTKNLKRYHFDIRA